LPGENEIIPAHADLANKLRNFSTLEKLTAESSGVSH